MATFRQWIVAYFTAFSLPLLRCKAYGVNPAERIEPLIAHSDPSPAVTTLRGNAAFEAFRERKISLVSITSPAPLSSELIRDLKYDAKSLEASGFGSLAGVAGAKIAKDIRYGVHQVWLQTPRSRSPLPMIGNLDARRELFRVVERLRLELEIGKYWKLPPEFVELSYLIYKPGSFYVKHKDVISDGNNNCESERSVSIIIFLGDHESESEWKYADGGAVRIHDDCAIFAGTPVLHDENGNLYSDVLPTPGTMVLFDAKEVPHEVLVTNRNRICVVGWFGSPMDS